ncbi:MAG TPA: AI-2E family transporter [Terracidiphilus sp.]|nr:AI-2E family transporter [Terracidiphilus sp.]
MTKEPAKTHDFRSDILFAFGLAAAAYLAWQLRNLLILLYVSALFAVVLAPVVQATGRIRIAGRQPFKGPVAILVLIVVMVGALIGFGFLAFPPVVHDLQSFGTSKPSQVPDLIEKLKSIPYVNRLNLNTSVVYSQLKGLATQTATQVIESVSELAGKIVNVITCFVLTVYFILDGDEAYRWCLAFVPPDRRQRLDTTLRRAGVGMGKWLLGQLTLMALLGLTSATVFLLLNMRYAYALGVIAGLLNIVPVLGAAIALVLALLVAALDSWGRVLGVVIFFAVYLQVENSLLAPRIMKSRVGLPSLAVFIALLVGFELAGIPGAMVAVPTAVLVAVLLNEYLVWKDEAETAPRPRPQAGA